MSDQKRILIIDDDDNFLDIFTAKLESVGFNVIRASDGEKGIKEAKIQKPDLILLDVQMPHMSGVEVISKIKSDPEISGLKILFLTNLGDPKNADSSLDQKYAQDAGAIGHMRKTDDLDMIVERIKRELSQ